MNFRFDFVRVSKKFKIGITINLIYVATEIFFGFYTSSLALLADAGHNFMDASSLFISLLGFRFIKTKITKNNTFGFRKLSILLSLINSIILLGSGIWIFYESIARIYQPKELKSFLVSLVALLGVFINFYTAYLFFHDKEKELNIKGAFLHMLADGLVSVGVVLSGVIIYLTNWFWIDPIMSLIIGSVIVYSSWSVLIESWRLSIEGVPKHIDLDKVRKIFTNRKEIVAFHDLHVWAISTVENALIVHVTLKNNHSIQELEVIKRELKKEIKLLGISHSTIEFDFLH